MSNIAGENHLQVLEELLNRPNTQIPERLVYAHWYSLVIHDYMVDTLAWAEKAQLFKHEVKLTEEQAQDLFDRPPEEVDMLDWLEANDMRSARGTAILNTVIPGLLSDFLHFIFEALETARKGKTTVSFALLRKPLQEVLAVFEAILISPDAFLENFETNLRRLQGNNLGGWQPHAKRIQEILKELELTNEFDAEWIARARYDKSVDDSFAGVSSQAIHLITTHKYLETELLNLNFVFSGPSARVTHWDYIYSRLPCMLAYANKVIQAVILRHVHPANSEHQSHSQLHMASSAFLWWNHIPDDYKSGHLQLHYQAQCAHLREHVDLNSADSLDNIVARACTAFRPRP